MIEGKGGAIYSTPDNHFAKFLEIIKPTNLCIGSKSHDRCFQELLKTRKVKEEEVRKDDNDTEEKNAAKKVLRPHFFSVITFSMHCIR